jgi:hypothetical protein
VSLVICKYKGRLKSLFIQRNASQLSAQIPSHFISTASNRQHPKTKAFTKRPDNTTWPIISSSRESTSCGNPQPHGADTWHSWYTSRATLHNTQARNRWCEVLLASPYRLQSRSGVGGSFGKQWWDAGCRDVLPPGFSA